MVVAFLPFPTRLIADTLHDVGEERVFVTMYGLTLLAIRLLSYGLDTYARDEHLYAPVDPDDELQEQRQTMVPVLIVYVAAILLGLAAPKLGVALYFALAVFLVVPLREVRRLIRRRT